MVSFEDDEDPANGSGDESQDEDEIMEDAEEGDGDAAMMDDDQGGDQGDDDDNNADDNEDDDEDDNDEPESPSMSRQASRQSPSSRPPNPTVLLTSPSPRPTSKSTASYSYPSPRPESISASTYDIVPTMAAPQSTSINALTATPDMRWVFSGGADGYVRMYNWVETANGKVPLTVAQKHPFVDSVMKAGSLTTYWENEETSMRTPPAQSAEESKETSPVYSLAVQREAIWLLSGLESGAINLQTCRHQAGTRIATLREHTSAVSVLSLGKDETSCLSGSWDKRILEWDLNNGRVKRTFPGSGAQISAIEVRPLSGLAVPEVKVVVGSETFSSNNTEPAKPNTNGVAPLERSDSKGSDGEDAAGSPDGSLFGENDHGSLFGDGDEGGGGGGGGGGFGDDDDDDFTKAMTNGIDTTEQDATIATAAEEPPPADITDLDTTTAAADPFASSPAAQPEEPPTAPSPPPVTTDEDPVTGPTDADIEIDTTDPVPPPKDPEESHPTLNGTTEQTSESTFLDAAIDGTIRIWDRRVPNPIATILPQRGTPPWCMGACWSPDGNTFYAGRRNGTVEEYSLHKGEKMGEPVRTLRFPAGSGAVSAVRAMPNGRGLVWYVLSLSRSTLLHLLPQKSP